MTPSVVLFDFDGVIIDSMPIRDRGFQLLFANYPTSEINLLMDFHKANGGLSRYVKIRYFYEKILGESITEERINELAASFSILMRKELTNPTLLIDDTVSFIKAHYTKYIMHIVSGSDQEELRFLCNELNLSKYFVSIQGSPTPKTVLVKNIINNYNYEPAQTVLIGDSVNDKDAAELNAITFIGYNNLSLKCECVNYINEFSTQEIL